MLMLRGPFASTYGGPCPAGRRAALVPRGVGTGLITLNGVRCARAERSAEGNSDEGAEISVVAEGNIRCPWSPAQLFVFFLCSALLS